ncbi:phosphonate ABC transporter, ATP-binding protein [Rubidibacter lacunae KORDI 51-2]|uniref:Phosphonate ABC transporter, ATP-binding protein n=1 Tax=Rubidibacter lacunae KORDI 51-2 TaxID=582515 RepID=U5DL86_9CHRO|nr:phosphonate ABC transporter ATP-binding protein [Rubidibacter lacunae]ERN40485.1 phosphonate ABC transporter, ATP-binding protein [Rubidibacter lacunae KORDI 51-2]
MNAEETPLLVVEKLTKHYDTSVLEDVSFTIRPRTFTAVLGPSGAGKSTLLRCILQLTRPDRGRVWFRDCELTGCGPLELRRQRSQIATIAQQYDLVRRRTALENCLGGRLSELPLWRCLLGSFPQRLQTEALEALARVQLLDVAFQRADRLSGGQKQRVAIARALTQRAQLVLADEPVASLDPQTARAVLVLLRSLCDREGLTVVCNLHQVEWAQQYSDRILGLRDGQLVLDRPTARVTESDLACLYGSERASLSWQKHSTEKHST